MNNENFEDVLELTPELLEQVSGGVMNDRAEAVMKAMIKALKNDAQAEHTPEETSKFVIEHLLDNVTNYVNSNWDLFYNRFTDSGNRLMNI